MRARFKPCGGTDTLIEYNEEKVHYEKGRCLYAGNFFADGAALSPDEKKAAFDDRTALNQQSAVNGISIKLEFAPGKVLDNDDLIDIAVDFLHGIGFARQPHLVYSHTDTACQHLHIVTTNIRHDGSRICHRYIDSRLIKPVRWEIIKKYGLETKVTSALKPHDPRQKIQYGKTFTRQAMADTLEYIMNNYQYRSLEAFNAILRLYNLRAYGGKPDTWLYKNRGLLYRVTDHSWKPVNAPTRASDFAFKPTLTNLEPRFAQAVSDPSRVRRMLDEAVRIKPAGADQFTDLLRQRQLASVPFHDRNQRLTGLFFVDLVNRSAISASELGPAYEPEALRQALGFDPFVPSTSKDRGKDKSQGQELGTKLQTPPRRGRGI